MSLMSKEPHMALSRMRRLVLLAILALMPSAQATAACPLSGGGMSGGSGGYVQTDPIGLASKIVLTESGVATPSTLSGKIAFSKKEIKITTNGTQTMAYTWKKAETGGGWQVDGERVCPTTGTKTVITGKVDKKSIFTGTLVLTSKDGTSRTFSIASPQS